MESAFGIEHGEFSKALSNEDAKKQNNMVLRRVGAGAVVGGGAAFGVLRRGKSATNLKTGIGTAAATGLGAMAGATSAGHKVRSRE